MSVAVIDIAGKQFTARVGTSFWVDKMALDVGDVVASRRIVLLMGEKTCLIGEPFEKEAVAYLRVQEHARGKKVLIFKKKRRHGYRRLKGFRADQTCLECVALELTPQKGLDTVCVVGAQSGALDKNLVPVAKAPEKPKKKETSEAAPKKKETSGAAPKKAASAPKKAASAQKKAPESKAAPTAEKTAAPAVKKAPVKKASAAKETPKKE